MVLKDKANACLPKRKHNIQNILAYDLFNFVAFLPEKLEDCLCLPSCFHKGMPTLNLDVRVVIINNLRRRIFAAEPLQRIIPVVPVKDNIGIFVNNQRVFYFAVFFYLLTY